METISASMIVKNEEICLEKCLQSLQGLDEIVILDTGSTDKTGEIARKYTDKYFAGEYKWNDNFAEARNLSISKCTSDWILTIDADEWLEEGGVEKIRAAISGENKNSVDFYVVSSNGKTVHFQPRLYRNKKEIFWKGAIHNYLNITDGNKKDITITYGYSPAHKDDPDRALRILQKIVDENPDSVREVFYLAREYSYRKKWLKALVWLNVYVTRWTWAPELAEAYLLMAHCYWYSQKGEKAREACLQAIKINTNFEEAIRFMAVMSGPKNRKRWVEFAETATNEDVLFNRSKDVPKAAPKKTRIYYSSTMPVYNKHSKSLFRLEEYDPRVASQLGEPVFFSGLYLDRDYDVLRNHYGPKFIFWNGSDVLWMYRVKERHKIVMGFPDAVHACHTEYLRNELKQIGIKALVRPIFFGDPSQYPVSFKPSETPHVFANVTVRREGSYKLASIERIASKVPEVTFHVYGVDGQNTGNLVFHGYIEESLMDKQIRDYQGVLRLNSSDDGFSQIVMKALFLGQYPITAIRYKGIWHAVNDEEVIKRLHQLREIKTPNLEVREQYLKIINNFDWLGIEGKAKVDKTPEISPIHSDLIAVKKAFDEVRIPWVLIDGLVLGYARKKAIIPWDTDIDLAICAPITEYKRRALYEALKKSGFNIGQQTGDFWYADRHSQLNIWIYHKVGDYYEAYAKSAPDVKFVEKAEWYDDLQEVDFLGAKYLMPKDLEDYLACRYGTDWKVEKPGHDKWRLEKFGTSSNRYRPEEWLASRCGPDGDLWPKIMKTEDKP